MSREHIANVLKKLRLKSGLTAKEVGEMIGKSGKTVSAWENNHGQPDAEILIALCDIYEVDDILQEFRENNLSDKSNRLTLSLHETSVITAYRSKPEMQPAVDKLLGVETDSNTVTLVEAARTADNRKSIKTTQVTQDELEIFNTAPQSDEKL